MHGAAIAKESSAYTLEEFLANERKSRRKHEFHAGQIYAMAGGSPTHALIGMNVGAALHRLAKNSNCRVFSSDLMVWIPTSRRVLYPDVSVICGPLRQHRQQANLVENPKLIVEVASPTTQDYDQASKFQLYQDIPEFEEYLVVSSTQPLVVHHLRQPSGAWLSQTYKGRRASIPLAAFPKPLSLRSIYAGVELPVLAPPRRMYPK